MTMHEVSIADSLLRQVAAAAAHHGLATVTAVGVSVGPYSGVVAEALVQAFEMLREGPVLGAASLTVTSAAGTEMQLEWIEGE
jgi:Zn finger protein HypA/HybF involved in hydrogenase expression